MVWRDPQHPEQGIAPLYYTIENNTYKMARDEPPQKRKHDILGWLEFLGNMWGERRGWWLSGAIAVSRLTDTYPRTQTNTDIALLREPGLFHFMVEEAEKNHLYLHERVRSYKKTWSRDDVRKYEIYHPVSGEEALKNMMQNRNYQFCAVDHNGNIITENRIYDRIKINFHSQDDAGNLISSEDKLEVQPFWLGNRIVHETRSGKPVYAVSIDYLMLKKRSMLTSWRWKRNPKHRQDLERMLKYLESQKSFPSSAMLLL